MDSVNLDISRLPNKDFKVSITGLKMCFLFITALFWTFQKSSFANDRKEFWKFVHGIFKYALHFSTFYSIFTPYYEKYSTAVKAFSYYNIQFDNHFQIATFFINKHILVQWATILSTRIKKIPSRQLIAMDYVIHVKYDSYCMSHAFNEYLLDVHLAHVWPLDAHKCSLIGFAWLNQTSWLKATR